MNTSTLLQIAVAVLAGIVGGYFIRKTFLSEKARQSEEKASDILKKTKEKEKELLLIAKEKALHVIEEAKQEEKERFAQIQKQQKRLEQREGTFDKQLLELEASKKAIDEQKQALADRIEEIKKIKEDQLKKLETISALNQEEAKTILLNNIEIKIKEELMARLRKLQAWSNEEIEKDAKKLLSTAMQRVASDHCQETTTTLVKLTSEEMKGRIIGKEGRNIKTIETLTGCEIIIDETPDVILVSGFNPIRRHIARRTLERLMADGRIQPARIEETFELAKKDIALDIKQAGEEAAYEVGVVGLNPKLIQILGRLKYRTSYGQNVLKHSIEVALISKMLGQELKVKNLPNLVKGGLLHDIGKALDHEVQGSHPELGYQIMKKFDLPEEVAYMAIAHHQDAPETLEGVINKVADAISGSRPGSRKDSYEDYVKRLSELEDVAQNFQGVARVFAIQAGREVRIFVEPEIIDDWGAAKLAQDIAAKIELELKYPGEIKVNVIRETRVVEYAR